MIGVRNEQRLIVHKDRLRFIKGHTMLPPVCSVLCRVPFESDLVMHFTLVDDDLAVGAGLLEKQLLGQAVKDLAHVP